MINLEKLNNSEPYRIFNKFYENALENNQDIIEAILIASMDKKNDEVEASEMKKSPKLKTGSKYAKEGGQW